MVEELTNQSGKRKSKSLDFDKLSDLLTLGIVSSFLIGIALITFVAYYDYGLIQLESIATDMESNGVIPTNFLTALVNFIPQNTQFIVMFDYIFLGIVISLVSGLFVASYKTQRMGYYTLFGTLSFGVSLFMFIASIFEKFTDFFYNIFFNVMLSTVADQLIFFKFYIDNFLMINLIVFVGVVLLQFFDFGISEFINRKKREEDFNVGETEI